jgi:putative ABC transport system permease protein
MSQSLSKQSGATSPARAPQAAPAMPPRRRARGGNPVGRYLRRTLDAFWVNVTSALEALWVNGLRSLLTLLGIFVGVAAVITAVTITQGTSGLITQRLAGLGTNVLYVTPGSGTGGAFTRAGAGQQTLKQDDATAIQGVAHVTQVTPILNGSRTVIFGTQNETTQVQGVYPSYTTIQSWDLAQGAMFTNDDETSATTVAVIGQSVVDALFTPSGTDPLGQTLLIQGQAFRVVGVLQSKGTQGLGNQDDTILVPFSAARARLQNVTYVNQILAQVDSADHVDAAEQAITTLLEQRHQILPGGTDDFTVRSSNQLVQTAQQTTQTLTLLLVGIAAISLVVGGIGILNIMLVSVTERIREIGIRIALGARRSDVRNQFLIEAVTLSVVGGLIGIGIGLAAGLGITSRLGLPFVINPTTIALAFGVSAVIGIAFGFYPAVRASRLDPIVALRTE